MKDELKPDIIELLKEPRYFNYESPIEKIFKEVQSEIMKKEDESLEMSIIQEIGYRVDKEELIKALKYDREQCRKGYDDALKYLICLFLDTECMYAHGLTDTQYNAILVEWLREIRERTENLHLY